MLIDRFGRSITYLRVSVTDRCNFRCVYCMPAEGIPQRTHQSIMRYEEIAEVVRAAAEAGIHKIRLTGGEPLVRLDLPDLVRMIAAIPGITDISLTTNGFLLERMAASLKDAGLTRINVSLDTLDPEKFRRITRGGSFETTWRGIQAAEKLGLIPIKINVVAMRGVNDDEWLDLARLSVEHGWNVRFIELMPVKNQQAWGPGFPNPADTFISIAEIMKTLEPLGLEKIARDAYFGPAQEYRIAGGKGKLGFISPLSDHFCQDCNRLRLTADGNLRPCLLQDIEVPFLDALRAGEPVLPYIQQAIDSKPSGHEIEQHHLPTLRTMMQIGG
ncbi:MAG TPA: GTP 3',8-cyclase MoaA [Anaerolineaceae bacterium]